MPSPFPGMDPYLEYPTFWSSFHTRLMVAIAEAIEVKERYLEVREIGTDAVITVIELLSVKNKRNGEGRRAYEQKRRLILGSQPHLVELDLLRGAKPMAIFGLRSQSPYRILISRSQARPQADLYPIALQHPLPSLPIPLKPNEEEPVVALQTIFNQVYERSRCSSRIDYRQPVPKPKLSTLDQQWVDELLAPIR